MILSKRPPKSTKTLCRMWEKLSHVFQSDKTVTCGKNAPRFIVHAYVWACLTNGAEESRTKKKPRKGKTANLALGTPAAAQKGPKSGKDS